VITGHAETGRERVDADVKCPKKAPSETHQHCSSRAAGSGPKKKKKLPLHFVKMNSESFRARDSAKNEEDSERL
jgi:hypothetical protein